MLAGVSRATYYRFFTPEREIEEEDSNLRDVIQQIALENRQYGYRRVTHALKARGWEVNHKRVARLMREDNLLALGKRRFVPATTDSRHDLEVAVNAARSLTVTGVNQLWVADITYVRLKRTHVFLAILMDAFSRKVVGWNVGRSLAADLPLTALQRALQARQPPPGLVHHSDRGIQYASGDYVDVLLQHGIIPSMSRPGNPYDNAKCERFMRTLKEEEIRCVEYGDLEELRANLERFIDRYYNSTRLHSALGYRAPDAYEQQLAAEQGSATPECPMVSFPRHEEIYPPDAAS